MRTVLVRPFSLPERLGLSGLVAAAAAVVYPGLSRHTGLGLPCPLRTLTGVPCPTCGTTTAATRLAGGDLRGALAANPFVLVPAGLTAVMAVLMLARAVGLASPPARWAPRRRRPVRLFVAALFVASWLFQLRRVGLI